MTDKSKMLRDAPLRIGISTRALFDLEAEHQVFIENGVHAYEALQLSREDEVLRKGAGFEVVSRLLKLNQPDERPFVEVILMSRNSPDLSLRAFRSIEEYKLDITKGSFTGGRTLSPFISAWNIDLFLSNEAIDVSGAVEAGTAAAKLGQVPSVPTESGDDELRIAFDGDAVVFSAESDLVYREKGLQGFFEYEKQHAREPMSAGPFGNFLRKLSDLREIYMDETGFSKIRIAIVTARNAPAHERVIRTLRAWGTPADEAHFVGHLAKTPVLQAFGAHIFFDDQEKHVLGAMEVVASGHVPGPHAPDQIIIPASR